MDKKKEIGKRLKQFAEGNYASLADFGRQFNKDRTFFTPYFNGSSLPGGEILKKLAELGCDINWLLTGEKGEPVKFDGAIPVNQFPILATVYAGESKFLDHQIFEETAQFAYHSPTHHCFAVIINGKSMETTLRDGDIVLVDMDKPLAEGCLAAVKLKSGEQIIKRYYDLNKDFIKLTSDNPEYGVRVINKKDVIACLRVVSVNLAL